MNQETYGKIKMHLERQAKAHSAVFFAGFFLDKENPKLGKWYYDNWLLIHAVFGAVVLLIGLVEHGTENGRLPIA